MKQYEPVRSKRVCVERPDRLEKYTDEFNLLNLQIETILLQKHIGAVLFRTDSVST